MTEDEIIIRTERARRVKELLKKLPREDGKLQTARSVSLKAQLSADGIRNILRMSDPQISTLSALAPALNCDLGYLTLEQDVPKKDVANVLKVEASSSSDLITHVKLRKIPVVSWAAARDTMIALERYINDSTPTLIEATESETLLATYAPDDSMSEEAREGDVIIYDYSDLTPVDRKFYLIVHRGRLLFRRYRNTSGHARFEAASKERQYDPIYLPVVPAVEVIGRVIKVTKDL